MRKWLILGIGAVALLASRPANGPKRAINASNTPPSELTATTRGFLLGFVMPLWLAAGVADWICHRRADIEHTAGPGESGMHLLMLTEAAVPVLAGLFLDITTPVLMLMFTAFLVHDATALWDVTFASERRTVTPVEQHVHSFLEMVPLLAVSFISVLHWPQVLALFGVQGYRRDWAIRRKPEPVPLGYIVPMLVGMVLLEWVPYLEELGRTLRTRRQ